MRISETPSPTGLTSPGLPSDNRRIRASTRAQPNLPNEIHVLTAVFADGVFNVPYEDGVAA
jgi:hypothetical protein